jgi:Cu/Ag efflux protein CusF
MRRLILAVVLMSGTGWALAQDPQPQQPTQPQQQPAPSARDSKEMTGMVVATDPTVKTITIKKEGAGATQAETTLAVDEKALTNLKTCKTGDKVKLILKTDPMTGKDSVTSIEKSKSTTPER